MTTVTQSPADHTRTRITPAVVAEHGLSVSEFDQIVGILGREPTIEELGIFSAMWSEHCGYKNSRPLLKTLPVEGPRLVQGPGENAGVIDAGDGWGVAFKVESHNHPSAVEPYQGAATGVGGILRDVFTMGARPVAVLDSLRFGSLDSPRSRFLMDGVVRGIGDYGNCVGVPTVGGETVFDPVYEKNPLVNAMCIGVLRLDRLVRGRADGVGNPVMAVGARTGRDGIHGATFASADLDEGSDRRPQVQVGDPFTEKLLLEATLELIDRDLLVGIQDMGAAGLTSSAAEMAARSGSGIDIDVDRLPVRESGMTAYEMLLSESQERMLLVARPERVDEVTAVLGRWELQAAVIGHVTDDGLFRVRRGAEVVAEIPVEPLVDSCPTYVRDGVEDPAIAELRTNDLSALAHLETDDEATEVLLALLDSPSIASRAWIYEQYDASVQTNTAAGPGSDAAVLRLGDTERGIAAAIDGNGRYVYLAPRTGARIAVCEAARNVACSGARPVAITNCLNFGNPLGAAVYYQLSEAVAGIGEACRALGTPVSGGNVSLYNETPSGPIYPTPVIGMVGVIESIDQRVPSAFRGQDDVILLVGETREEIGGSEYLAVIHDRVAGTPPAIDLDEAARLVEFLVAGAAANLFRSAHDCSDGGMAIALAEAAIGADGGARSIAVELESRCSPAAALFGESQNRVLLSADPARVDAIGDLCVAHGLTWQRIGTVGPVGGNWRCSIGERTIDLPVDDLRRVFERALPRRMEDMAGLNA
ncbi:MAG: phosphoribosylformylglycinamidine synthase subunit PurL [Gemmatimonadota bacterium]|nr:phosphoribosylformylglycinamidine synthase subunit PurL [Gemmatimonadota bacterium]